MLHTLGFQVTGRSVKQARDISSYEYNKIYLKISNVGINNTSNESINPILKRSDIGITDSKNILLTSIIYTDIIYLPDFGERQHPLGSIQIRPIIVCLYCVVTYIELGMRVIENKTRMLK